LLAATLNFTFRYIDDVLSLNNSKFGDFVDRIFPIELEIKYTADTYMSASYLDLHLEIDSEGRWNIVSTERYILHMQVLLECCFIYKWKVHNEKIEIISFVVKFRS
jgi:hypothetical protein